MDIDVTWAFTYMWNDSEHQFIMGYIHAKHLFTNIARSEFMQSDSPS